MKKIEKLFGDDESGNGGKYKKNGYDNSEIEEDFFSSATGIHASTVRTAKSASEARIASLQKNKHRHENGESDLNPW